MNREFEERKRKLLEYLKEEYKEEPPQRWWHSKKPEYKTTWDFANINEDYRREDYNVIIRNDKKGAASSAAFLFLLFAWMFYPWNFKNVNPLSVMFMMVILIFHLRQAFDRRPKVILDANGLWTHKWSVQIPWHLIVATYIKEDNTGEDKYFELIVHFYDAWEDEFCEASYKPTGLEVSNQALAYYIEYWKMEIRKKELHFPDEVLEITPL